MQAVHWPEQCHANLPSILNVPGNPCWKQSKTSSFYHRRVYHRKIAIMANSHLFYPMHTINLHITSLDIGLWR